MPRSPESVVQQSAETMGHFLPVNVSVWGIFAGYLGLFSILVVPAPFAILCSVMTFRDLKRNPRHYGMSRAIVGLVGGVIGLGLGALIFVPILVAAIT